MTEEIFSMADKHPTPNVNTQRDPSYPNVGNTEPRKRRRRRLRLVRANTMRGPGGGAPAAIFRNMFPFPFGDSKRAQHGHHPVFPVGAQRRVGAWRRGTQLGVGRKNR